MLIFFPSWSRICRRERKLLSIFLCSARLVEMFDLPGGLQQEALKGGLESKQP